MWVLIFLLHIIQYSMVIIYFDPWANAIQWAAHTRQYILYISTTSHIRHPPPHTHIAAVLLHNLKNQKNLKSFGSTFYNFVSSIFSVTLRIPKNNSFYHSNSKFNFLKKKTCLAENCLNDIIFTENYIFRWKTVSRTFIFHSVSNSIDKTEF